MIFDLDAIAPEYEKARQALTTARAKKTRALKNWMEIRRTRPGSPAQDMARQALDQATKQLSQAEEHLSDVIHSAPEYKPTN